MEIFHKTGDFLACGHVQGSPLEIIVSGRLKAIPPGETYHYHPYHEYYIILAGRARLKIHGREIPLEPDTVVMVAPGEPHAVCWVDPLEGVSWVVVKERSAPGTKFAVPDAAAPAPPPGAPLVRPFTAGDQVAARRLILAGLGEHFGQIDETRNPDLDAIAAHYGGPDAAFVVAEVDGALAGTGALTSDGPDPAVGWLVRVSVAPAYRRQGVARAIVHHLIALARARGLAALHVETNNDWYDAIGLYAACGFTPYAEDAVSVYLRLDLASAGAV
jgi:GNAT superfamily N-acetyltransferase